MNIRTWVMKVANKNALSNLINLAQKRELEEFFICQITADGAVHSSYKKDDVIAILSSKGIKVQASLEKISRPYLLDDLDDDKFRIDDEGAELKDVLYPASEDDEVLIIEKLH